MIQKIDEITKIPTFITGDFDEPVLYTPARTEFVHPCTSLKIITAFTDCERISTHMISLAEGIKNNRLAKGLSVEILLGMTKSAVSHQLKILRQSDLITYRKSGKNVFYTLADDHVRDIIEKALEHIKE